MGDVVGLKAPRLSVMMFSILGVFEGIPWGLSRSLVATLPRRTVDALVGRGLVEIIHLGSGDNYSDVYRISDAGKAVRAAGVSQVEP